MVFLNKYGYSLAGGVRVLITRRRPARASLAIRAHALNRLPFTSNFIFGYNNNVNNVIPLVSRSRPLGNKCLSFRTPRWIASRQYPPVPNSKCKTFVLQTAKSSFECFFFTASASPNTIVAKKYLYPARILAETHFLNKILKSFNLILTTTNVKVMITIFMYIYFVHSVAM